jgi:hypothetical protein
MKDRTMGNVLNYDSYIIGSFNSTECNNLKRLLYNSYTYTYTHSCLHTKGDSLQDQWRKCSEHSLKLSRNRLFLNKQFKLYEIPNTTESYEVSEMFQIYK